MQLIVLGRHWTLSTVETWWFTHLQSIHGEKDRQLSLLLFQNDEPFSRTYMYNFLTKIQYEEFSTITWPPFLWADKPLRCLPNTPIILASLNRGLWYFIPRLTWHFYWLWEFSSCARKFSVLNSINPGHSHLLEIAGIFICCLPQCSKIIRKSGLIKCILQGRLGCVANFSQSRPELMLDTRIERHGSKGGWHCVTPGVLSRLACRHPRRVFQKVTFFRTSIERWERDKSTTST